MITERGFGETRPVLSSHGSVCFRVPVVPERHPGKIETTTSVEGSVRDVMVREGLNPHYTLSDASFFQVLKKPAESTRNRDRGGEPLNHTHLTAHSVRQCSNQPTVLVLQP